MEKWKEQMDLESSNKLIAEFMGYKSTFLNKRWFVSNYIVMRYHSSWDWLIPVIKKIRGIINVELNIDSFEEIRERKLTLNPYDYDMEQVYKAVVEFIKWYNQNKE